VIYEPCSTAVSGLQNAPKGTTKLEMIKPKNSVGLFSYPDENKTLHLNLTEKNNSHNLVFSIIKAF